MRRASSTPFAPSDTPTSTIAPGPGRLDVIYLPPPTVTGLYLVDSALAGQWDVFRNAAAHLVLPSIVLAGGGGGAGRGGEGAGV